LCAVFRIKEMLHKYVVYKQIELSVEIEISYMK